MTARIFNVLIGTWLIATAFAWGHRDALAMTTLVCGVLTAVIAIGSIFSGLLRLLGVAVAAVLFIVTGLLANRHEPTFWNNLIAAAASIVSTLLMGSGGRTSLRREREQYGQL
jgi:divalent metal cation (Fe/Co/Zn/Cd) transporter